MSIGTTLFSVGAYYASSALPGYVEVKGQDYEHAKQDVADRLGDVEENKSLVNNAPLWVKDHYKSVSRVVLVASLVFHGLNMYMLTPAPIAVGLTLLKCVEIHLLNANPISGRDIPSGYTAGRILRIVNRLISMIALQTFAFRALSHKPVPFITASFISCAEGMLSLGMLYGASGVIDGKSNQARLIAFPLAHEEIFIPHFIFLR